MSCNNHFRHWTVIWSIFRYFVLLSPHFLLSFWGISRLQLFSSLNFRVSPVSSLHYFLVWTSWTSPTPSPPPPSAPRTTPPSRDSRVSRTPGRCISGCWRRRWAREPRPTRTGARSTLCRCWPAGACNCHLKKRWKFKFFSPRMTEKNLGRVMVGRF